MSTRLTKKAGFTLDAARCATWGVQPALQPARSCPGDFPTATRSLGKINAVQYRISVAMPDEVSLPERRAVTLAERDTQDTAAIVRIDGRESLLCFRGWTL